MRRLLSFLLTGPLFMTISSACSNHPGSVATSRGPGPSEVVPFTVSGTITGVHAGPLAGATVTTRPHRLPPRIADITTITDERGFYRINGLMEPIILEASKEGYIANGRSGIPVGNSVVNLTLNPKVSFAAGTSVHPTRMS